MKWIATSVSSLAVAVALSCCATAPAPAGDTTPAPAADANAIPAYVTAAAADPARGEDLQIDARRHGAELVAFSGVKPGDTVLELVPGSGYFTRIFSKVVGPNGHVYAAIPTPMEKYSDDTKKLPEAYPNVEILLQPANALATPALVDVAFTSQNYHDYPDKFMGPTDPAVLNAAVFRALKPGGLYVIVDHRGRPGTGLKETESLHRIDIATVKAQAKAAGFVLVAESPLLANPADPKTVAVFDKSIRGHTDQFAYKFRKPR